MIFAFVLARMPLATSTPIDSLSEFMPYSLPAFVADSSCLKRESWTGPLFLANVSAAS